MSSLVPSFVLKADRAEKHLCDLKREVAKWTDTHPYKVGTTHHRKRNTYHLRFTSSPDYELGTLAADFVYNVRSGLDHLMAALVPKARRDKVYFPVYFAGVWEDAIPGENAERTKERGRWQSDTAEMRPEALAILKALQPDESAGQRNSFRVINALSNRDKHRNLSIFVRGLIDYRLGHTDASGKEYIDPPATLATERLLAKDGAELQFPKGAVDVKILGTPVIAIEVATDDEYVVVPEAFEIALLAFRRRAIEPLAPYVHPDG